MKITVNRCSFCNTERSCITSDSGNHICFLCLQNSQEVMGDVLVGAIACLKCKKHDKLEIEMVNKTKIRYRGDMLDSNGLVAYSVVSSTGKIEDKVGRRKATCGHCKSTIPLYLLSRSDYIL